MSKTAIIQQLIIMAEAYGLPFAEARMEIYADMLSDIPVEKLRSGIVHLVKTRTFAGNLPSVAEIREAVAGEGNDLDARALLAWNEAKAAIHDVGNYQSVTFADPIIMQIIRTWGGWEKWGDWPTEETKWKEKDFIHQYKVYAKSPDSLPDQPTHLIGSAEAHNQHHFPDFVPEPVQIGGKVDEKKRLT